LFGDGPIIAPQVRAGNIVAVAVAGPKRGLALPDVITMAEAGHPGIEAESWFGLVVSSKVPAPVIQRLQAAVLAAQRDPAYQESLAKQGASAGEPGPQSRADQEGRRKVEGDYPGGGDQGGVSFILPSL
jgi:tripartite-type tricarboxylate transporter receptor subunit TctC